MNQRNEEMMVVRKGKDGKAEMVSERNLFGKG